MKTKTAALLEVAVAYGNLSLSDHEGKLPLTFQRCDLALALADEYLCGSRLTARILARPEGVTARQNALPGLDGGDVHLDGQWDSAGFRVSGKTISGKLSFALAGMPITKLAKFSGREGILSITAIDYLDDTPSASKADDEAEAA